MRNDFEKPGHPTDLRDRYAFPDTYAHMQGKARDKTIRLASGDVILDLIWTTHDTLFQKKGGDKKCEEESTSC